MTKNCNHCGLTFEITSDDLAFYEKVSPVFPSTSLPSASLRTGGAGNGKKELIPPPTMCPECRLQQRFTWRNDRKLYHRKCDLTGKQIISIYAPDKPYTVYEQSEWWSDKWDAIDYGRDVDLHRPFFPQFAELLQNVPIPSLHVESCDNSDYGNFNWGVKNCYLTFASDQSQDCYYSHMLFHCSDCVDCAFCKSCSFCYQLLDSEKCYRCFYSKELSNCDSVDFSFDCKNCKHCFGCTGLRGKEYYLFNASLRKEEYAAKLAELTLTERTIDQARERAWKVWEGHPRLYAHLLQCEECTGDNLFQCKNCRHCFDGVGGEDCAWTQNIPGNTRDCHDIYGAGYGAELSYLGYSIAGQRVMSSFLIYPTGSDILYSAFCGSSDHLFGCIGVKRKQYCILNKQYTKEEYEELVPKIIARMRSAGEWGEFFPSSLSPFAYNESLAQDYFPLTKEQAGKQSRAWREEEERKSYLGPDVSVPESIQEVDEALTNQILRCSVTGKPYKIIPQELAYYKKMGIPVPKKSPDQRYKERLALRNPRKLWDRNCAKCKKAIATSYAPDRPEIVYCEECYLASVY